MNTRRPHQNSMAGLFYGSAVLGFTKTMTAKACDTRARTPEECYALAQKDAAQRYGSANEAAVIAAFLALAEPPKTKSTRATWKGKRNALLTMLEMSFGYIVATVGDISSTKNGQEWSAVATSRTFDLTFELSGNSSTCPSPGGLILIGRKYNSRAWCSSERIIWHVLPEHVMFGRNV